MISIQILGYTIKIRKVREPNPRNVRKYGETCKANKVKTTEELRREVNGWNNTHASKRLIY